MNDAIEQALNEHESRDSMSVFCYSTQVYLTREIIDKSLRHVTDAIDGVEEHHTIFKNKPEELTSFNEYSELRLNT